jgi:hypothetical protein
MIVKLDHVSGAEIQTAIPHDGGLPPVEIAHGVLTVLPGVRRVRVWADGRSFLDEPSADVVRGSEDEPTPEDEALREARKALAEWLADSLGGAIEGLGPTSSPEPSSVWERWYSGAEGVMAAAQQSDGFTAPV